jgi:stress-induced morphogen
MLETLESVLINDFNPNFLAYEFLEQDVLNVVISSPCFINQPMTERVRSVYSCLEKKHPAILEEYTIYINAFTDTEITDLRDFYAEQE